MAVELELGIYIYNADKHQWLGVDERYWTDSIFDAACFTVENGRDVAQHVMERVQGDHVCYLMMEVRGNP